MKQLPVPDTRLCTVCGQRQVVVEGVEPLACALCGGRLMTTTAEWAK